MGNLCVSMSKEDVMAAKASKEVDQANEAAFKKVCTWDGPKVRTPHSAPLPAPS